MYTRFDRTHERDGQTDRRRVTAVAELMHSIARQKRNSELDVLSELKLRQGSCIVSQTAAA